MKVRELGEGEGAGRSWGLRRTVTGSRFRARLK